MIGSILATMDDKVLIAIIGLVGSIVGGLLVSGANWLLKRQDLDYQREKDSRELWHAKLEAFHFEINEFITTAMEMVATCLSEIQTVPPEQLLGNYSVRSTAFATRMGRLHSMQQIYMPECEQQFSELATLSGIFTYQLAEVCEKRTDKDTPLQHTAKALQVVTLAVANRVTAKIVRAGRLTSETTELRVDSVNNRRE